MYVIDETNFEITGAKNRNYQKEKSRVKMLEWIIYVARSVVALACIALISYTWIGMLIVYLRV